MSSFSNQNKDIKGPTDTNKYYNEKPLDDSCTDQDKLDPKSDCYDPQNAQLKIKEEKSGTINYDNIARGYNTVTNLGADAKNYYDEMRTKLIPGKANFAYGEKEKATEIASRGPFDARTGRDAISGFEGVIGVVLETGLTIGLEVFNCPDSLAASALALICSGLE